MGFGDFLESQLSPVGDAVVGAVGTAASSTVDFVGDAAGVVRDDVGSLLGFDTRAENAQQEQAAAAKKEGQQQREDLAAENQRLDAPAGYDPASLTQQENWQSYDHRHIYDTNQNTLKESDAAAVGDAWKNIGDELGTIGDRLKQRASKAITSGWSGQAADAANQSSEPLADWMRGSGECFKLTGNKIKEAASAAGQSKAMVPPPQDHDISQSFVAGLAGGPTGVVKDGVGQMHERQQEERKAQETMGRVLGTTYKDVDSTVPAYRKLDGKPADPPAQPPPPEPPGVPPARPPGYTGDGSGGVNSNGGSAPNGGGGPNGDGSGDNRSASPNGPGGRDGGANGRTPQDPRYPSGPGGTSQGPAGSESAWTSGVSGGPGGAGGAGVGGAAGGAAGGVAGRGAGGGGAGGGYAAGGMPGGTPGSGSNQLGQGGRSGTAPVKGTPSTPSTSSTSSTTSGRGGGRMPMGGMGGQNQGGADEEHERESWLVEDDDVWLNDMPKTAPPVFE
ncbi:hypothetical protein FHX42_000917 [Saccharopolyspora lacisalsi]|uniref:PPE domain-containing protein n=1 Tax=Halosaccharopolyspora lacisalsi TaxID=1000566 RepID=A0A839DXW6_9PSEU|nr:PPE domain-containing protein [Halosaccharopolyspora lacisalsi]MBA8823588.1 hypothetical protein [Halosaccharopolyspora lacisalsi]